MVKNSKETDIMLDWINEIRKRMIDLENQINEEDNDA